MNSAGWQDDLRVASWWCPGWWTLSEYYRQQAKSDQAECISIEQKGLLHYQLFRKYFSPHSDNGGRNWGINSPRQCPFPAIEWPTLLQSRPFRRFYHWLRLKPGLAPSHWGQKYDKDRFGMYATTFANKIRRWESSTDSNAVERFWARPQTSVLMILSSIETHRSSGSCRLHGTQRSAVSSGWRPGKRTLSSALRNTGNHARREVFDAVFKMTDESLATCAARMFIIVRSSEPESPTDFNIYSWQTPSSMHSGIQKQVYSSQKMHFFR